MNIYYVAAIWLGLALIASVVSIRIAVPAALVEIVVGALAGNIPGIREHVTQTDVRHPLRIRADPDRPAALPARHPGQRGGGSTR